VPYDYEMCVIDIYIYRREGNLNSLAQGLHLVDPSIDSSVRDSSILFNKVKCIGVSPMYMCEDENMCIILSWVGDVVFIYSRVGRWGLIRDVWM
jgi:hypothetical protein